MTSLLRTVYESLAQAWGQLVGSKLRTALSLLGVSIGIFCIVAVQTAVDSLADNVVGSLSKLGDNTLYIQKFPWGGGEDYPWWEYLKRPNPTYAEYEALSERLAGVGQAGYFTEAGNQTVKWRSNSVRGVGAIACSPEFDSFFDIPIARGRNLTQTEYHYGSNVVVLGFKVAEELFGPVEAVGRQVRMFGQKLTVVGVIDKSGEDLIQVLDFDQAVLVSYLFISKVINVNSNTYGGQIMVQPVGASTQQDIRDQVTVGLRAERRLKPTAKQDFAINNLSFITESLGGIFQVLNLLGYVVGGFAILVGGFSVANIMFVSVEERTSLIGVKMALGAPRTTILLEFLIESVALCLIGGAIGIVLVLGASAIFNTIMPYETSLSVRNLLIGVALALAIGVVAGIFPAFRASKMDPVDAIRS